jgi:glycosyltransferase involved in cell wall biosynthesis
VGGRFVRILFVADTLGSGGKERQLVELLKGLDGISGVQYCLCLLSRNVHYDDAKSLNGTVHYLERKVRYDPWIFVRLYSICRKFRPDVIQSWELMCSVYSLPVAKLLGIKFVNMIRNAPETIPAFGKTWIRSKLTFPFSDLILANSEAGLRAYGIRSVAQRPIHNGFDFNRLKNLESKENVRSRFGINSAKIVGMVGKFHPKKDNATFLRAAIRVCTVRDDVTFLAVGDGVNLERCKKLVPPELAARILFVGKQKQVEAIVNLFDIGVLATFTEGISNSIMEYMALGKPVVATKGGGTAELVIEGVTGFLVGVSDPEEMAKKIIVLLDDPQRAAAMGRSGRERLEREFNLAKMTDDFVRAYERCVNQ